MAELGHKTVRFQAGTTLFRDGDARLSLYIINSGQIEIYKMTADGFRLPLAIVGSGEYLGETGLLDGHPFHASSAVALTDVEAIEIPASAIQAQLKLAPAWLVALTKGLAQKLRRTNDLIRRNRVADEKLTDAVEAAEQNERDRRKAK